MNIGYYIIQWYEKNYPPNRWQAFLLLVIYSLGMMGVFVIVQPYGIAWLRLLELQEPMIRLLNKIYIYGFAPFFSAAAWFGVVQITCHLMRAFFNVPYFPIHRKLERWGGYIVFASIIFISAIYQQVSKSVIEEGGGYLLCQAVKVPVAGQEWQKIHSGVLVRQELAELCQNGSVLLTR